MKFYLHCSVPYQILHTLGRRDGYCCPVPVFQTEQHLWLAAFGSAIKYNSPLDRPDMFTFYLLKSCSRIHKEGCVCCLPVTCSGACCGPWVPPELCEETSAHPRRGAGLGERHDGHWGFFKRGLIFIYLFLWGKIDGNCCMDRSSSFSGHGMRPQCWAVIGDWSRRLGGQVFARGHLRPLPATPSPRGAAAFRLRAPPFPRTAGEAPSPAAGGLPAAQPAP